MSVVVAIDSFTGDAGDGVPLTAVRGSRWRDDHPLVVAHPEWFCEDGLSDAEMAQRRARVYGQEPAR